jgi:hypothetical protein
MKAKAKALPASGNCQRNEATVGGNTEGGAGGNNTTLQWVITHTQRQQPRHNRQAVVIGSFAWRYSRSGRCRHTSLHYCCLIRHSEYNIPAAKPMPSPTWGMTDGGSWSLWRFAHRTASNAREGVWQHCHITHVGSRSWQGNRSTAMSACRSQVMMSVLYGMEGVRSRNSSWDGDGWNLGGAAGEVGTCGAARSSAGWREGRQERVGTCDVTRSSPWWARGGRQERVGTCGLRCECGHSEGQESERERAVDERLENGRGNEQDRGSDTQPREWLGTTR